MTYLYRALNPRQEMVKGEVLAGDRDEALKKIRSLQLLPLEIKERIKDKTLQKLHLFKSRKVKKEELMVATRELSVMLKAGIPILRALRILIDANKGKKLGDVLDHVYDQTKNGESLAGALEKEKVHFSDTIINMVRTGERTGELPQVLHNVSKDLEHALLVSSEVKNALAYPTFLLAMSGLALFFIFTFVIPKFTAILDKINIELPLYSRIVLRSGTFVNKHLAVFLTIFLLLGYALVRLLKKKTVRYGLNRSLLRIPLVKNLIVHIELSRFSHALAILLKSGVEIINSIHMSVQAMGNIFLRRRFSEVAGRLKRGDSLHHALQDVDLFPRIAVHMIEVGEETGKLPEILEELSTLYMEKFRTAMKRLISLLEPAIISIVGIVIGFIVISLVSAIMSMNDIRF